MTGQPVIILLRPWNGVKAILSQRPTQSAFRPELVGMGKPTQPGYQRMLHGHGFRTFGSWVCPMRTRF